MENNNEFVNFNRFTLKAFLLQEITRHKFPTSGGLVPASQARAIRKRYAAAAGIPANAKPEIFIASLKIQYEQNDLGEDFAHTLKRFGLDTADFQSVIKPE